MFKNFLQNFYSALLKLKNKKTSTKNIQITNFPNMKFEKNQDLIYVF